MLSLSTLIGALYLAKAFLGLLNFMTIFTSRLTPDWADRYGKGSWTVVTGCTEGIGKAFCFELAKLGFNLVLISRNSSKLEKLSGPLAMP